MDNKKLMVSADSTYVSWVSWKVGPEYVMEDDEICLMSILDQRILSLKQRIKVAEAKKQSADFLKGQLKSILQIYELIEGTIKRDEQD